MKQELVKLALATLELWGGVEGLKAEGLFGEAEPMFSVEPECVKMARAIIRKYGDA